MGSKDARQQELDFFGGLIDHVPLESRREVAAHTLRKVLRAVYLLPETCGGKRGQLCWFGQAKIASAAGVSFKHTGTALTVLVKDLGVLLRYREAEPGAKRGGALDHYCIVWTELSALRVKGASGGSSVGTESQPTSNVVTRPERGVPATRPESAELPATRPGRDHGVCGGIVLRPSQLPVCQPDLPLGQPDLPLGQPDLPLGQPDLPLGQPDLQLGRALSALLVYGVNQKPDRTDRTEKNSTAAFSPESGSGADLVAAVELRLRELGIGVRRQLIDGWIASGRDFQEVLAEVNAVVIVAQTPVNRQQIRDQAKAIAWRLKNGAWPCDVNENVTADTRPAVDLQSRYGRLWREAYQRVRRETPQGQYVDEDRVIDVAVQAGVPREWCERECGILTTG